MPFLLSDVLHPLMFSWFFVTTIVGSTTFLLLLQNYAIFETMEPVHLLSQGPQWSFELSIRAELNGSQELFWLGSVTIYSPSCWLWQVLFWISLKNLFEDTGLPVRQNFPYSMLVKISQQRNYNNKREDSPKNWSKYSICTRPQFQLLVPDGLSNTIGYIINIFGEPPK